MVDSTQKEIISYTRTPEGDWLLETLQRDDEVLKVKAY